MPSLYLLRHAPAASASDATARRDAERPLTDEGRRRMARGAEGMRHAGVQADAVLSSPFRRARETAAIVAECLGMAPDRLLTLEELASGARWSELKPALRSFAHLESVVLVGHQPDLSTMAAEILGSGADQVPFGPGSLARILADAIPPMREATLEWLLRLDQLERLSRD